jgi:protein involved in polysaccharide export with SLBB domain
MREAPRRAFVFTALAALLSGCLGTPLHNERKDPPVQVRAAAPPPQPDGSPEAPPSGAPAAPAAALTPEQAKAAESAEAAALATVLQQVTRSKTDYRISAADLISVTVYQDSDMSRKVRVNANGAVTMPLIGAVKIGGMTLIEAQSAIETKLAKYLVSPQVSLFIEDYGSKLVYVMGEVQKPGSYPIPAEKTLTVLEAISTAGGFTPIAGQDRTRVLRNVNGASVTYTIEVKAITQQGQKDKDLVLEPNDVVYVPQSFF